MHVTKHASGSLDLSSSYGPYMFLSKSFYAIVYCCILVLLFGMNFSFLNTYKY